MLRITVYKKKEFAQKCYNKKIKKYILKSSKIGYEQMLLLTNFVNQNCEQNCEQRWKQKFQVKKKKKLQTKHVNKSCEQ